MSMLRGIQSVIFYYVSCAPCTKYTAAKKRKKQIARDTEDRNALELASPDAYSQPLPYRTNEFWAEEIQSGPGPPPRNVTKKERENRRQAKRLEEIERRVAIVVSKPKPALTTGDNSTVDNLLSVDGMRTRLRQALPTAERWRRNQREDEALWGSPSPDSLTEMQQGPVHPDGSGRSNAAFPGLAHSQASTESFYIGRNPPINDLHPPVVSNPSVNKTGNKWMLQPPPSSDIMNGFISQGDGRSRSVSGGSAGSWRKGGDVRLARQISQRLVREKLSRGELISSPTSPPRSPQYEKSTPSSPKQQMVGELSLSTSAATHQPALKFVPSPSSSFTATPGMGDSGIDVNLPPQNWPSVGGNVPGTSQQDFVPRLNDTGLSGVDGDTLRSYQVPQSRAKAAINIATLSRSYRSATTSLAVPARAYYADTPRGTISASTSSAKTRQRRDNNGPPSQSLSAPIRFERGKEPQHFSDISLVSHHPQASTGAKEYFSHHDAGQQVRQKQCNFASGTAPARDNHQNSDADADTDTEDQNEDVYNSMNENEKHRRNAAAAVAAGCVGSKWGNARGGDVRGKRGRGRHFGKGERWSSGGGGGAGVENETFERGDNQYEDEDKHEDDDEHRHDGDENKSIRQVPVKAGKYEHRYNISHQGKENIDSYITNNNNNIAYHAYTLPTEITAIATATATPDIEIETKPGAEWRVEARRNKKTKTRMTNPTAKEQLERESEDDDFGWTRTTGGYVDVPLLLRRWSVDF